MIESIWPTLKIVLAVIFLICCLLLPFLLIYLGLSKKKLTLYIQQVKKKGKLVKKLDSIATAFDPLLIAHIFDTVPSREKHPQYFKFKTIDSLEKNIKIASKIAKPIAITTGIVATLLIVLLNIYGE